MISVVICSVDDRRFEAVEKQYARVLSGSNYELIRIPDATGICEGYSRGLAQSKGEIVVFSHDDLEFLGGGLASRLESHLSQFDAVGVAGTDKLAGASWSSAGPPHLFGQIANVLESGFRVNAFGAHLPVVGGMQALDGVFLAFRRSVIEKVRWDAETYDGFHLYDTDCTFRAYRSGFRLAVASDIPILHASGGNYDDAWQRYAKIFIARNGQHLAKRPEYEWTWTAADVPTRLDALRIMTPDYLSEE